MAASRKDPLLGLVTALFLGAVFLSARSAGAYCRTTTCDAADADADCTRDERGCSTSGAQLYWPARCLSFNVQRDGSTKRSITADGLDGIVSTAFDEWEAARCSGGTPSFEVHDLNGVLGAVECADPEYNRADEETREQLLANANVWMFRDLDWPYVGSLSTLALTTVTFGVQSGKILDADVELNSFAIDLTASDDVVGSDLASIATHEAGHFLGLAHSNSTDATMNAAYQRGTVGFRTLGLDDEAGICAVYPPDRAVASCVEPTLIGGWASECGAPASDILRVQEDEPSAAYKGCSCDTAGGRFTTGWSTAVLAALGALVLRARSGKRG